MFRLSFLIIILFVSLLSAQSPHGNSLKYDCSVCHESTTWNVIPSNIKFKHDETNFPLKGQHTSVSCTSCHESLIFNQVNNNCFSCHKDIHQNTLGNECYDCHNTFSWGINNIEEIHNQTRFPLIGKHKKADCIQCHSGFNEKIFEPLSIECYDCHFNDYQSAKFPDHIAAGFSKECSECHSINSNKWNVTNIKHDFFPLTGGHNIPNCFSCHQQETFLGLSTECASCHLDTYTATINPNHSAAGITTNCQTCHNINSWIPSTFNHISTGFELLGRHATIDCSSCHVGTTTGLQQNCISCHLNNYNSAPAHLIQNYPLNCEMCHNSVAWNQTNFNHNTTIFPLTGAHLNTNCSGCHSSGFSGTTTICSDCHINNYNSSVNPSHTNLLLPTDCNSCHTTNPGWKPASFSIHNNYYQLIGAHSVIANNCITCHNGNYNNTPNTCFGCHQSNYNSTTNPPHASAGFPVDCVQCHSQNVWVPSTFQHDNQYFPIYSGKHRNTWTQCSNCHINNNNYAEFSCLTCHEHRKDRMDDKHSDVSGYVYESNACLACHPTGEDNLLRKRFEVE